MTTSKFNTVVIAAIAAVFSFVFGATNVSAQSLTQSELDSLNVLNLRTIQASISDKTHKDFKWVSEGQKTSNKIEVTNRTGILIGAEGGYNFNHGYEAGLKIGYQGAFGLRQFAPEAAAYAGQVKVDGQSYTTYGVEARANFEFGSDAIKFFAGPTVGYKYFTVDTGVMFDDEQRNHNQHSNAFTVGVNGGLKIKIGHTTKRPTVSLYGKDGQKHAKKAYTVKNPIYLTISGSYRAYNVDKPGNVTVKVQETGIKASLTFLF